MKKLLILLLAVGFAAQLAAVKVAIVGDRDLADLATARCSRLKNVELLERAEVEAALREIKLSQAGAAELAAKIPHAGLIMVFDPAGRVVIFDACRGGRLADFAYRATLEETATAAAETLAKLSDRTDQLATMPKLGIAMVNDLGVPKRLRSAVEKKLIELERKLAASPKILLLERSNLGAVNVERNLSDARFPLDPSMLLLRIDFEPGSRSGAVNCAVRVTDLAGQVLAECQEVNLLENPAFPDRLVEAMVKIALNPPPPSPPPPLPPSPVPKTKIHYPKKTQAPSPEPKTPVRESGESDLAFLTRSARIFDRNKEYQKAIDAMNTAIALASENQRSRLKNDLAVFKKHLLMQSQAKVALEREALVKIDRAYILLDWEEIPGITEELKPQVLESAEVAAVLKRCRRLREAPEAELTPVERNLRKAWLAKKNKDREKLERAIEKAVELSPDDRELRHFEWTFLWRNRFSNQRPARLDEVVEAIAYLEKYDLNRKVRMVFRFARPPFGEGTDESSARVAITDNDPKALREGETIAQLQRKFIRREWEKMPVGTLEEVSSKLFRGVECYYSEAFYFSMNEWRRETPEGVEKMIRVMADFRPSPEDPEEWFSPAFIQVARNAFFNDALLRRNREAYYRNIDAALQSPYPRLRAAGLYWQLLKNLETDPQMPPEAEERLIATYLAACDELAKQFGRRDWVAPDGVRDVLPGRRPGAKLIDAGTAPRLRNK